MAGAELAAKALTSKAGLLVDLSPRAATIVCRHLDKPRPLHQGKEEPPPQPSPASGRGGALRPWLTVVTNK